MAPPLGVGAGTPSPRKESDASAMMADRSACSAEDSREGRRSTSHGVAWHGWSSRLLHSGFVSGQAMELVQVRLEPEEESGHFPSKRAIARPHPRRLVDLFGEIHNPRLKPQGLVETLGDLAEVGLHGLLLGRRSFRHR